MDVDDIQVGDIIHTINSTTINNEDIRIIKILSIDDNTYKYQICWNGNIGTEVWIGRFRGQYALEEWTLVKLDPLMWIELILESE